jgi:hypothetical protein
LNVLFFNECFSFLQIVRKNFQQGNTPHSRSESAGEEEHFIQINPQLCVSVEFGVVLLEKMRRTDCFMAAVMESCEVYL